MPTKPPPACIYLSKAISWLPDNNSPVVLKNTNAAYFFKLSSANLFALVVVSILKSFFSPNA